MSKQARPIKARRFYPKQVLGRLDGRAQSSLDAGERVALSFFLRHWLKLRVAIRILSIAQDSPATVYVFKLVPPKLVAEPRLKPVRIWRADSK